MHAALDLDGEEDLNSYESLKAAIEKNYDAQTVEKILSSFAKNGTVIDIGVPDDIPVEEPKTESLSDKQLRRIKELSGAPLNSVVMSSGAFNR